MSLPELVRVFTAALYNETALSGYSRFRVGEIVERYSLEWKPTWADNFAAQLRETNYARVYEIAGGVLDYYVSIAAGGVHWVERALGENLASYLEAHGAVYTGEVVEIEEGAIDSALWTGSPSPRVIEIEKRERLISLLIKVEQDLESIHATNSEKALARAYVVAARALAEAPEPPEDIIWELISRASKVAGVASLFLSIIALFVGGRS